MALQSQPEAHFADLLEGLTAGDFAPKANFITEADLLLFVNEDCSYATQRVDPYLSMLWHPTENKIVGFKLKGIRYVFNQIKEELKLTDKDWLPLSGYLESVFTVLASRALDKANEYLIAKSLAGSQRISTRELAPVGAEAG